MKNVIFLSYFIKIISNNQFIFPYYPLILLKLNIKITETRDENERKMSRLSKSELKYQFCELFNVKKLAYHVIRR